MKTLIAKAIPKLNKLKNVSASIAILGTTHFCGHFIVESENFCLEKFNQAKDFGVLKFSEYNNLVPKNLDASIIPFPKLTSLQDSARLIAVDNNINPLFFCALIKSESNWNVSAKNKTKDGLEVIGLGQLLENNIGKGKLCPEIKNKQEAFDPIKNLNCAAKIVRLNLDNYNQDGIKTVRQYKASVKCIEGTCPEVEKQVNEVFALMGKEIPVSVKSKNPLSKTS